MFSLCLSVWLSIAVPALAQSVPANASPVAQKNILLVYSYGHGGKGVAEFDDGLVSALNAGGISANNLFFEYLDLERHAADTLYPARMRDYLLQKYAHRRMDLIIAVQQPARNFLLHEGRNLASQAPLVTVQAAKVAAGDAGPRRVVSVLAQFDIKGTLERALELFPETRRVVIVAGASDADRAMAAQAARIAADWQGKLEFEYTSDLAMESILRRLAALPDRSIVLFAQYNRDPGGRVMLAYEVEALVVKAAHAPVFGLYDFNLINGGIGGSVVSVRRLGEKMGQVSLDILAGRLQLTQPVTSIDTEVVPMFDWRGIERWGGDATRLPANAVFLNRSPTLWEQYSGYASWALVLVVAQFLLIAALVIIQRSRSLAEQALLKSESRYRNLVETTQDLITGVDAEGRFTFVNQMSQTYLGLAPEACVGLSAFDFVHPDDLERTRTSFAEWLGSGEPTLRFENRQVSRSGEIHRMQWSVVKEVAGSGKTRGFRSIARDVTQERRVEDALRASRDAYMRVLTTSPDGFWQVDREGRLLDVNDAYVRMSGYSREELLRMRISDVEVRETEAEVAAHIRQIIDAGGGKFEAVQRRKDGTIWHVEISTSFLASGGGQFFTFLRDISERKREERLLRLEHAISRCLAEADDTSSALKEVMRIVCEGKNWGRGTFWRADETAGLLRFGEFWNQSQQGAERYTHGSREVTFARGAGLVGRVWESGEPIWVADFGADPRVVQKSLARETGMRGALAFPVVAEGRVLGVLAFLSREVREPDERLLAVTRVIGREVGQFLRRKQAEDQVRRLNAELERRIAERTQALEVANRELESYSYSVSHDLRAPLRAINGFSHLLEVQYAEKIDSQGREMLRRVRDGAQRMGQLIDDLLKLSRISRQEMKRGPVDLSALAREAARELQVGEPERRIEWMIAPNIAAEGDEGLIRVALENLIGNAWKYSSKRDLARIEFGVGEKDGRKAYFVRDNGAGFDMAYADKLFGAFQRLHTLSEFPGTGIGLATVARIVHRHGGEVWAEGRVGEGSAFHFTL